jgi:hypothetical protein
LCGLGVFWINVYQIRLISKVSSQNNHKIFDSKRTKRHTNDRRNRLCSPMPAYGEPLFSLKPHDLGTVNLILCKSYSKIFLCYI